MALDRRNGNESILGSLGMDQSFDPGSQDTGTVQQPAPEAPSGNAAPAPAGAGSGDDVAAFLDELDSSDGAGAGSSGDDGGDALADLGQAAPEDGFSDDGGDSFSFPASAPDASLAPVIDGLDTSLNIPESDPNGGVPLEVTVAPAPDSVTPDEAPGAAGTIQTMADYLSSGYWVDTGRTSRWFNLTDSGTGANFGTIYYNVSGFVGSMGGYSDSNGLDLARRDVARAAFEYLEDILGINFVETTNTASYVDYYFTDNVYTSTGGERAFNVNFLHGGTGGPIDYNITNITPGWYSGLDGIGNYTFQTFIHEISHGLGLGHQGDYNAGAGTPTYDNSAIWENDTWQLSIMSYWSQNNYTASGADYAQLISSMSNDMVAYDTLYGSQSYGGTTFGTNNAYTGNTIWGVGTNVTTQAFANLATMASVNAFTIVDGGGTDTVDFSNFSVDQTLNLQVSATSSTTGTRSNVGGLTGNMMIAPGTVIENAKGGSGNDTITGNDVANSLTGNAGDDDIKGLGGNDALYGNGGADSLYGGSGLDFIYGANGVDGSGDTSANSLYGETGNDYLRGGDGNDSLYGGDDNDELRGNAGDDALDGGDGTDEADYYYATSGVTVDLVAGTATGGDGNDTLIRIEGIGGSTHDDMLYGNNFSNTIYGQAGDDYIDTRGGTDIAYGGDGNDTFIHHHLSGDYYAGGAGADTLVSDVSWVDSVQFDLLNGEIHYSGNTYDTFGSIENVTVGGGADVQGSAANNVITFTDTGSTHTNSATGGDGNDVIHGGIGNDVLQGDGGNDSLYGDADDDTLKGLDGNDYLYGGTGSDTLLGGNDTDYLYGASGVTGSGDTSANSLYGDAGNDFLRGGDGNDTLDGGTENDELRGNDGDDTLTGGAGTDQADYYYAAAGVTVNLLAGTASGGDGNDTLSEIENIEGSGYNDTLTGDNGVNEIWGGNGDDNIDGGAGDDTLHGGAGNDYISGGGGVDAMYGDVGDDVLSINYGGIGHIADGGAGSDTIDFSYSTGSWTINLIAGTTLLGTTNYTTLISIENAVGAGGNDTISGTNAANTLEGGNGNDTIDGLGGDDILRGGVGNDMLDGGNGVDTVEGGDGDDTIINNDGFQFETLDGGLGIDTLDTSASAIVNANYDLTAGLATFDFSPNTETILNFENLNSGSGDDSVIGTNGDNVLMTNDGDDDIAGRGGADSINSGLGNDVVYGGNGNDTISGEADDDRLFGNDGNDHINAGDGNDRVFGGAGVDTILGGEGHDLLLGFNGNDTISGNFGNDEIDGGTGGDTLDGGVGDDVVDGGDGRDKLYGGHGADHLIDGAGIDRMWGGFGADTFDLTADGVYDRIFDYEDGTDRIRIVGETFAGLTINNTAAAGRVRIDYGTGEILFIDDNGAGLLTASDFTAADFVFV